MQSKKKLIKKAKAKQKQEDSKLLPIRAVKNINHNFPNASKILKLKNIETFDLHSLSQKYLEELSFEGIANIPGTLFGVFGIKTWNKYKPIYRFDPELAKELVSNSKELLTSSMPTLLLDNLPFPAVWIELDNGQFPDFKKIHSEMLRVQGILVYKILYSSKKILCLEYVDSSLLSFLVRLEYDGHKTLKEAIVERPLDADEEDDPKLDELMDDYIAQALSLVLYLCANNADVRESKKSKNRISGAGSVTEWDVGVRYGNAIRAYAAKEGKSYKGSHSRKRPHWRKGHFQHYWTGPRSKPEERKLILNWIEPVLVNEELTNIDKLPAVIHKVENDRK